MPISVGIVPNVESSGIALEKENEVRKKKKMNERQRPYIDVIRSPVHPIPFHTGRMRGMMNTWMNRHLPQKE
jgi:hypothetical protein